MTDEERQRAMDFIVAQQAKNSVEIDKLIEAQRKAELRFERDEFRLDRDERILKLVISAGRRERRTRSEADERFKNDRDLDRLERILTATVNTDSPARRRMLDEDKRWREFDRQSRRRFAEISEFAARSDEKLKALIDDTRNDRNKPRP